MRRRRSAFLRFNLLAEPGKETMDVKDPGRAGTSAQMERILYEVKKIVVGQDHFLERVLVAVLAQGHLLVEGVPGLAKTLTVKTLARTIRGSFKRIQFTPDLVPADLVGTRIYNQKTGDFTTSLGPVFTNLLLADEINRAPAKVQSALLEVMQEHQVTIAHTTYPVPDPFLVMATQNPIESEGTYPLPEAQVDRFMLKILIDYPEHDEELTIVHRALQRPPVVAAHGVRRLRRSVARQLRRLGGGRDAEAGGRRPSRPRRVRRLRREPARADQHHPGCTRPGSDPRPRLRDRRRREGADEGRATTSPGAEL